MLIVAAAGLVLSACAASLPPSTGPVAAAARADASAAAAAPATPTAAANVRQRDLSAEEKKVIVAAVATNLRDPASARYHWTRFPETTTEDSVNYCATVDAKSPYPPYNGRQAYILEARIAGGKVIGATMGLIAGGKDVALVAKMCAKYGLDPNKAI